MEIYLLTKELLDDLLAAAIATRAAGQAGKRPPPPVQPARRCAVLQLRHAREARMQGSWQAVH
jgi:hypothetical protein